MPALEEPEQLREPDGYKLIFVALAGIKKEVIIRKTEAFDKCLERSSELPQKGNADRPLPAAEGSRLARPRGPGREHQDVRAHAGVLRAEDCNLSREDRGNILQANRSNYTKVGIEQALRVSFHDLHEKEKGGGDEQGHLKARGYGKGCGKRCYAHTVGREDEYEPDEEAEEEEFEEEGPGSDVG